MSAAEILDALPKLERAELKKIAERALHLSWDAAEREAMGISLANAEEGFLMMDRMEAEDDARRIPR